MKSITRFGVLVSILIIILVACSNNDRSDAAQEPAVIVNSSAGSTPVPNPSAETPPATLEATIRITPTGFEPSDLTMKVGTTVQWVNDDTYPHWVASDPYPIHTNLLGFDAERGIEAGQTYRYTFTKLGTWTYHDHLRPVTYTGKITVTD